MANSERGPKGETVVPAESTTPMHETIPSVWLEKFMTNATMIFGFHSGPKKRIGEIAAKLDQLGYFGFAHLIRIEARPEATPEVNQEDKPH